MGCLILCIFCDGIHTDKYFYISSESFPLIKIQTHTKTHPQTDTLPCPRFASSVSLLLFLLASVLVIPR